MLLGYHTCDLTNKRLNLPTAWKDSMRRGGFVTQGFERNLFIFNLSAFEDLYEHIISLNIADPKARLLIRLILGSAHPVNLEKNKTILLPTQLIELAELTEEAVVIGQGDYCEIWSSENWSKQQTILNNTRENTHRFASLNLYTNRIHDSIQGKL